MDGREGGEGGWTGSYDADVASLVGGKWKVRMMMRKILWCDERHDMVVSAD